MSLSGWEHWDEPCLIVLARSLLPATRSSPALCCLLPEAVTPSVVLGWGQGHHSRPMSDSCVYQVRVACRVCWGT